MIPYIVTCENCFRADEVTVEEDYLTNEWVYTCNAHDPEPHVWRKPAPTKPAANVFPDGRLEELGVYEILDQCIDSDDPWMEWGVIEDRFRRRDPELYALLIEEYSHSARDYRRGGPDKNPTNTRKLSNRLAQAVRVLARDGHLEGRFGPATGYWSYNTRVSHWAPNPAPDDDDLLTWEKYAMERSLDPTVWELPKEPS